MRSLPLYIAMVSGFQKSQRNLYLGQLAVHVYALPSTALQLFLWDIRYYLQKNCGSYLLISHNSNFQIIFILENSSGRQHSVAKQTLFNKNLYYLVEIDPT